MAVLPIFKRFSNAVNAFRNSGEEELQPQYSISEVSSYRRPDRPILSRGNERTIITAIYNRIAVDVSTLDFVHAKVDDEGNYVEDVDSYLQTCLKLSTNVDQSSKAFFQDVVMSMLDEGVVAIVPVDTLGNNPRKSEQFDVLSLRTAKIIEWKPYSVKLKMYNDRTGKKEELWLPKRMVAIVENPFYAIMNAPNSTFSRLVRKLNIMDSIDELNGSGKLDLIIQLPYLVKSQSRKEQANLRLKEITDQLSSSNLGIAYTDGTERIVQLNRSVENQMMNQVEYLTSMLYSQLGITAEILQGNADEKVMLNYYARTIGPMVYAIIDEMTRKFISSTALKQGQRILAFRDPFKLVPVSSIADIADKFTRNEIMSSNELRQKIGMKPSNDPKADMLINSNLNHSPDEMGLETQNEEEIQNG